ncbi:YceI family protein [Pseudomonas sp. Root562]|uniref:YceI family protein n=1 Tax=Pseudomonas sp. Root562 TaxID=1736561 RepID=UPI000702BB66|nr:YceI family protein [Pseudomonas sp. Root562]KQZ78847.1 polyisoprenoid-binding protein [Pseudomonas sp. Root562]
MSSRASRFIALASVLLFGAFPCAHAVEYTDVNPTASTLSFTYNQMGSRVYGTFSKFVGVLDFDTTHPQDAHAKLTIDLDSIEVDDSDARTELPKPAWFDTATYPKAIFESTRVKDLGSNRYLIAGRLTLRGLTREVEVPVLLKAESAVGIFDGELTLKRSDFKIGAGEWADSVVSNDIYIRFRIVAPER